jgi:hypothetical protein
MSSSNQENKLAYWLPKLEVYRAAMEASPEVHVSIPESTEMDAPLHVSEVAEEEESSYYANPQVAAEAIVSESIDLESIDLESIDLESFDLESFESAKVEDSAEDEVSTEDELSAVVDTTVQGWEAPVVSLPEVAQVIAPPVERTKEKRPIEVIPFVPAISVYVGEESSLPSRDSENSVALPQVVHLPIDGILKKLKGLKSFVLGIGTVGKSETQWSRQVVRDTVSRCCEKTGRNAVLVSIRSPEHSKNGETDFQSDMFREVCWTYFGDSKADTKAWHAQLSDLPKWKKEFGLIIFDLGDVRLPTMPRIGRLCDGIVVQLLNAANSRDTIQALKGLQKNRLKILGVWSVELNAGSIAA